MKNNNFFPFVINYEECREIIEQFSDMPSEVLVKWGPEVLLRGHASVTEEVYHSLRSKASTAAQNLILDHIFGPEDGLVKIPFGQLFSRKGYGSIYAVVKMRRSSKAAIFNITKGYFWDKEIDLPDNGANGFILSYQFKNLVTPFTKPEDFITLKTTPV